MEHLEGDFDGLLRLGAALGPAIDVLEDGRLAPIDGPDGGGVDQRLAAVRAKLGEHRGQLACQLDEAQVGVPQAQIKCVGHPYRS
jgi:hypothetical protein